MIFKSYIIEKNLEATNNCKVFLFYGENQGLKEEFKKKIQINNKNNEVLNFLTDEVVKNEKLLIDEILNKSLFNEKKNNFYRSRK